MHKIHALQIFINFFSFFFGRNTNIYIFVYQVVITTSQISGLCTVIL